ncbi:MAG: hypothetical protein J6M93_07485 [Succinivibrio sp.]|nr:hypothetical protein [Succinivibrio sp.]
MITIHSSMLSSIYRNAYAKSGNKAEALETILGKNSEKKVKGQKNSASAIPSVNGKTAVQAASEKYSTMVEKIKSSLRSSENLQSDSAQRGVNGYNETAALGMDKLRAQQDARLQKALETIKANKNLSEDQVTLSTAAIEACKKALAEASAQVLPSTVDTKKE